MSQTLGYAIAEDNAALVALIGQPRRVLDVGCGVGLNGAAARRRGAHVVGIETNPQARERATARLHEVLPIDLRSAASIASLGERRFDLILFGDVLEHLVDPAAALVRLCDHLVDGGHVLVSLPNIAAWTTRLGLLAGRFDYDDSGILDRTHLRFFTRASARALLSDCGLEIVAEGHNPMIVRALRDQLRGRLLPPGPVELSSLPSYQLYRLLVRPLEERVCRLAPELLAFQHVFLARKPPRRRRLSLTVGMLTMDEEESVAPMIAEIRSAAPDADIVLIDSSRDRTPVIARDLGATVIRQLPPRGHGPAMERLMREASLRSELLIYLDCDFTYPPRYLPLFRRLIEDEGYDVVNGARTQSRPAAMPLPNYLANRGFAALAHFLHGVPTVDVHSGMRAYRTSVIRAFDFDGEGDAIPVDTLLMPAKRGYRVAEIPIDYDERVGPSKLRKLAGTAWTFIRLGKDLGRRGAPRFDRLTADYLGEGGGNTTSAGATPTATTR